jgi:hypothetical protein
VIGFWISAQIIPVLPISSRTSAEPSRANEEIAPAPRPTPHAPRAAPLTLQHVPREALLVVFKVEEIGLEWRRTRLVRWVMIRLRSHSSANNHAPGNDTSTGTGTDTGKAPTHLQVRVLERFLRCYPLGGGEGEAPLEEV